MKISNDAAHYLSPKPCSLDSKSCPGWIRLHPNIFEGFERVQERICVTYFRNTLFFKDQLISDVKWRYRYGSTLALILASWQLLHCLLSTNKANLRGSIRNIFWWKWKTNFKWYRVICGNANQNPKRVAGLMLILYDIKYMYIWK